MQVKKRRYKANLSGLHESCELSYIRLRQLIADWDSFDELSLSIDPPRGPAMSIKISELERNPYTTTIMLRQQDVLLPWADGPNLTVRVYHDARMAEVVSWNRHRLLQARYDYPNTKMYLPDEKAQLNQFLAECLQQCLRFGRMQESILAG